MIDYKLKLIINENSIKNRVKEIAKKISDEYKALDNVIVIGILKGAFIFLADLIRHFDFPVQVDFIRIASYGSSTETSGTIKITKDVELNIEGKNVLLVEDIVDTGLSLEWVINYLKSKNPASLKVCVFIDKKERRECEVQIDYTAYVIEQGFLVGYGLDYSENHRQLNGVYEVIFDE